MQDLKTILESKYAVISISGPHAGELENDIFRRKKEDIIKIGRTFWLSKSRKAKPPDVQSICIQAKTEGPNCPCIFIEPSAPRGSKDTKRNDIATQYSEDARIWRDLPKGLGPVTGNLNGKAHALVFSQLYWVADQDVPINLWDYAEFKHELPIKTARSPTVCAIKKDTSGQEGKMKSHIRKIVAVGTLSEPYCVYIR